MATGRRAVAVSPGGSLASARRLGHVTQRPERRFLRGRVGACVRGVWTEPGVQRARDQRWLPSRSPVMTQGEGTPVSSLHAAGGGLCPGFLAVGLTVSATRRARSGGGC